MHIALLQVWLETSQFIFFNSALVLLSVSTTNVVFLESPVKTWKKTIASCLFAVSNSSDEYLSDFITDTEGEGGKEKKKNKQLRRFILRKGGRSEQFYACEQTLPAAVTVCRLVFLVSNANLITSHAL